MRDRGRLRAAPASRKRPKVVGRDASAGGANRRP